MKAALLAGVAFGVLALGTLAASPAAAIDMAPPPPVYPAYPAYRAEPIVVYGWSGLYLGIEGGGGVGSATQTDASPFTSGPYTVSGGLVGGTIGYNWQFDRWVYGLEGDWSGAWISGTTPGTDPISGNCNGLPPQCQANLESLGTIRGRIGFAFERFLPYATFGFAIGTLHGSEGDVLANGGAGSGTTTVGGFTVGAGVEVKFTPNWSGKVEYLHVDLGNHAIFNEFFPGNQVLPESISFTTEIVRAGVNYRF
jgi:outer membrane immunogenic protein